EHDGKLSFQTDAWTSPNHCAYVALVVNFEIKGTPISTILNVVEVPESHTGKALAHAFVNVLESFGIEDKILICTCDNAPNNNTMTTEQARLLPAYSCSLLRHFNPPQKKGEGDTGSEEADLWAMEVKVAAEELIMSHQEDDDNKLQNDSEEIDEWVDEDEELMDKEHKELKKAVLPVRRVLVKLCHLSFKMINSTMKLLPAWKDKLEELSMKKRLMP
ncbi:hypothetical protein DXG01_006071, partial [Tephrocybe rancida]